MEDLAQNWSGIWLKIDLKLVELSLVQFYKLPITFSRWKCPISTQDFELGRSKGGIHILCLPWATFGSKNPHLSNASVWASKILWNASFIFSARPGLFNVAPTFASIQSLINRCRVLNLCIGVRGGTFLSESCADTPTRAVTKRDLNKYEKTFYKLIREGIGFGCEKTF